jgi:hypothetical protein
MLELSRQLLRQFRTVLRRSLVDQEPRGLWPLLLASAGPDGLVLQASQHDLAVCFHQPGDRLPATLAFRSTILADLEGRDDTPAVLETVGPGQGQARWEEKGQPRLLDFETVPPDSVPPLPELPRRMAPSPVTLLLALDEAARTTVRESHRRGLMRVLLRGRAGEIIATDGRQLLVQSGFTLPWPGDVLVPRVPALGDRGLSRRGPVSIGRNKTHVAVRIGPWTFLLAIDTASRFPDIRSVIPPPEAVTARLQLDLEDRAFLATELAKRSGCESPWPVTLDLATPPAVRVRPDEDQEVIELLLSRSTVSGSAVQVCVDRLQLLRALKLRLPEVAVVGPERPVLFQGPGRTYVCMSLDPTSILRSDGVVHRLTSGDAAPLPPLPVPEPERSPPMPAPSANGHVPDPARSSVPPERNSLDDVIAETEALRTLLQEASGRSGRLLTALKQQRRQRQAVRAAVASLRQLQLDP